MTDITVVTTFNREGMDLYGQRFIDSFAKNVDEKVKLVVFAEDCEPNNPNENQIKIWNLGGVPKLSAFKDRWKDVPKANGKCPFPEKRPRDHHKEFKWDAVRFAHKVYSIFYAVEWIETDRLVWMDGDTVVHSPVSYDQFLELLPKDKWLTYVGRGSKTHSWPECGFYGMNLKFPVCRDFLKKFEEMYENAEQGIFRLDEWHDSYVFGYLLDQFKKIDPEVLDYSAGIYNRTAKTGGGGHPYVNSVLGKYFDHMKGDRKTQGKSKTSDLIKPRPEDYWST